MEKYHKQDVAPIEKETERDENYEATNPQIDSERTRNNLSVKDIKNYLHSMIKTNADDIQVRKLLVNMFIKEIILDNETVTMVYNFTENPISERITNDTTNSIIKRSEQVALNKKMCSNILPSLPPQGKRAGFKPALLPCGGN